MAPLIRPILIIQGATFTIRTQVDSGESALDLMGYSAKMQVRRLNRPLLPAVLDLETGAGIVFESGGVVFASATADQTRQIPYVPGRKHWFDLILRSPAGNVYSLVSGRAVVRPGITDELSAPMETPLMSLGTAPASQPIDYSWIASVPRTAVSQTTESPTASPYDWVKGK